MNPTALDRIAQRYFTALEQVTSLPAQRWSETVARCSRMRDDGIVCGGPESFRPVGGGAPGYLAQDTYSVCADCGKPWAPDELEVGITFGSVRIRGRIGTDQAGGRLVRAACASRADVAELRGLTRAEACKVYEALRLHFERWPRAMTRLEWRYRLGAWRLYLRLGTYSETATSIAKHARWGPALRVDAVQARIEEAREIVARRMERREKRAA
jgi:hypothetical protein